MAVHTEEDGYNCSVLCEKEIPWKGTYYFKAQYESCDLDEIDAFIGVASDDFDFDMSLEFENGWAYKHDGSGWKS